MLRVNLLESCIDIQCAKILNVDMENVSFVVVNYLLQFVLFVRRQYFLQRIVSSLNDGGMLLLSERVEDKLLELQHTLNTKNCYQIPPRTWMIRKRYQRRVPVSIFFEVNDNNN